MAGVYSLATAIQKVEQKPDAEVSVRDAQDFVRYCMAIVADLTLGWIRSSRRKLGISVLPHPVAKLPPSQILFFAFIQHCQAANRR
jgi:hypothetical protein